MEIIAKTKDGVIISATNKEVEEILQSVTGEVVKDIKIGQKVPAIDYAASIRKVKELNGCYEFNQVCERLERFNVEFYKLRDSLQKAASLEM